MQPEHPYPQSRAVLALAIAAIVAFLFLAGIPTAAAGSACDWGVREASPAESRTAVVITCPDCQPIAKDIDAANDVFTAQWILLRGSYGGCLELQRERADAEYSIMPLDSEIGELEERKRNLEPRIAELRRLQGIWPGNFDDSILADGRTRTYREVYAERLDQATVEMGEINRRLVEAKQEVTPLREKLQTILGYTETLGARQSQLEGRIRRLEVKLRKLLEKLAGCEREKCKGLPPRATHISDSFPPQGNLDISVYQADFSKITVPACPACRESAKALNDAVAKAKAMQTLLRNIPDETQALEKALGDAQAPMLAAKAALDASKASGDPATAYDAYLKYEAVGRATAMPARALQDHRHKLWGTERDLEKLALEIPAFEQALRACEQEKCVAAPPEIEVQPEMRTDAVQTPGVVPVPRPAVDDLRSVQDRVEPPPPGGVVIPVPPPEPGMPEPAVVPNAGMPNNGMGGTRTNDAQRRLDGLREQQRQPTDESDSERERGPEDDQEQR